MPLVSIVTPTYKDARRLELFGEKLASKLAEEKKDIHWVIADDGSGFAEQKQLSTLLERFLNIYPSISLFTMSKHLGKGGVIKDAWERALASEWLAFIDADGSIDPNTVIEMVDLIRNKGAGYALITSRKSSAQTKVTQPFLRKFAHYFFNKINRILLPLTVYDAQCGMKIINGRDYEKIKSKLSENGLNFDTELLLELQRANVRLDEVPINWTHVGNGVVNPLKDALPMLKGVLRLRKKFSK